MLFDCVNANSNNTTHFSSHINRVDGVYDTFSAYSRDLISKYLSSRVFRDKIKLRRFSWMKNLHS